MTSAEAGRYAEGIVAAYLERYGCTIAARNWRTRMCEIDIVAERQDVVYFCEVKYRAHTAQGTGIEYITPKKLAQMRFAAESWVHRHGWAGDYQLCAVEVSGPGFRITRVEKDL